MTRQNRLVLDANILLRAAFGVRVRTILENFEDSANFYTPDIALADARKYVDALSIARKLDPSSGQLVLNHLMRIVQIVDRSLYEEYEVARERMRRRDLADWPIAATALLLECPIWTEDRDFFGSGIATWTTANIEVYLRDT